MKEITWTKLKAKKLADILQGECLKTTDYSSQKTVYIIVNPQQVMKDRVEGICQIIDAGRG